MRGICPEGWHLPTEAEWNALIVAIDGSITEYVAKNTAGTKLKFTTGWDDNGNGSDDFGFSARPAGVIYNPGGFNLTGKIAFFWSATEFHSSIGDNNISAIGLFLYHDKSYALLDYGYKQDGLAIRCLKD